MMKAQKFLVDCHRTVGLVHAVHRLAHENGVPDLELDIDIPWLVFPGSVCATQDIFVEGAVDIVVP